MEFLDQLNDEQKKAVQHFEGPALVLAGAGSGKTRVITYRIAYLHVKHRVSLHNILAVTFTNKAADEMRERVESLLGISTRGLWIGTFHSMCARILRYHPDETGFASNFSIYDASEQKHVIKKIMDRIKPPSKKITPAYVKKRISMFKNNLVMPEQVPVYSEIDYFVTRVYSEYQDLLVEYNAMDFDDLLVNTVSLLENNERVRKEWSERFRFILVDEYQDTNYAQYVLLKNLTYSHKNLFVVGDDDQSIYGFRGANLENILNFDKDFPDAAVYKLERNYRSTPVILHAASSVIANNAMRKGKTLWTVKEGGEKISVFHAYSDLEEAEKIADFLERELKNRKRGDVLIAYRTNAQSRVIEEVLRRRGIPHRVVKGIRFFERKEIKDILGYLRFIINPNDMASFVRIVNTPPRGIGRVTVNRILSISATEGISLIQAVEKVAEENKKVRDFINIIEKLKTIKDIGKLVKAVVVDTGYSELLEDDESVETISRKENVEELFRSVEWFKKRNPEGTLQDYLAEVSLLTDIDTWEKGDAVNLMTLHNTKGLEFPVVFISGMNQMIFPHSRSLSEGNIEEERRLFYVGLTRAIEKVYLSYFSRRIQSGGFLETLIPSQFLSELPEDVVIYEDVEAGRHLDTFEKKKKESITYVEHPVFGRGRVLRVEDGDKLVIAFKVGIRVIKRSFFEHK